MVALALLCFFLFVALAFVGSAFLPWAMPTGSWPDLSNGLLLREVLTVEQPATGFLVREGLVAGGLLELLLAIGFVLFSAQSLWLIFGVLAFGIGFAVFSSLRPYNVPQFWAFVSLSPMAMALFLGVTPWLLMICVGLLLLLPGYLRLEPDAKLYS